MASISRANYMYFIDKAAAAYLAAKGTSGSGYGLGDPSLARASDWGASRKVRDIEYKMLQDTSNAQIGDTDIVTVMLANLVNARDNLSYKKIATNQLYKVLVALNELGRTAGDLDSISSITDLETYLKYYNYGAGSSGIKWQTLAPPDFRTLYYDCFGVNLDAKIFYSPAITSLGSRAFGGAFSDGSAVDTASYAGVAVPTLSTNAGYTQSSNAAFTITGNGRDADGNTVTGRTWTATVTANGAASYTLTPATTGDILTDATAISNPAQWTGGTVTIVGGIPTTQPYSTRTDPPS